ncbi:hypothetical protein T492DRAFT_846866 [Pavlovales sp. CCMP2436]|nr:hypothetical protein T492DRAFT_846866 [Pavlovales sp. CCMP2436]
MQTAEHKQTLPISLYSSSASVRTCPGYQFNPTSSNRVGLWLPLICRNEQFPVQGIDRDNYVGKHYQCQSLQFNVTFDWPIWGSGYVPWKILLVKMAPRVAVIITPEQATLVLLFPYSQTNNGAGQAGGTTQLTYSGVTTGAVVATGNQAARSRRTMMSFSIPIKKNIYDNSSSAGIDKTFPKYRLFLYQANCIGFHQYNAGSPPVMGGGRHAPDVGESGIGDVPTGVPPHPYGEAGTSTLVHTSILRGGDARAHARNHRVRVLGPDLVVVRRFACAPHRPAGLLAHGDGEQAGCRQAEDSRVDPGQQAGALPPRRRRVRRDELDLEIDSLESQAMELHRLQLARGAVPSAAELKLEDRLIVAKNEELLHLDGERVVFERRQEELFTERNGLQVIKARREELDDELQAKWREIRELEYERAQIVATLINTVVNKAANEGGAARPSAPSSDESY